VLRGDGVDARIEELDLTVRSFNCLKRQGINTIADLINYTESELIGVRNLGSRQVDEVLEKLSERNLSLKTDPVILESTRRTGRLENFDEINLQQLLDVWPTVLEDLQVSSWVAINSARPVLLEGDVLTLDFADPLWVQRFKEKPVSGPAVYEDLREAIVGALGVRLRFVPRAGMAGAVTD